MKTKGFTLIELVVVITIIGILAAIALPRFTSLQADARTAKLNAARGAVASASALVHATILPRANVADAAACPGGGGIATNLLAAGTLCTEAGVVQIANGYPASALIAAAIPGIIAAAGITQCSTPRRCSLQPKGIP